MTKPLRIGISGGRGFVGRHLSALLISKGYAVTLFGRSEAQSTEFSMLSYARWDPKQEYCDTQALGTLDAMVHLAGAGIADKRWTAKRKKEIYDSRINGTRFLVEQLKQHAPNCKQLLSASAIGWYGQDGKNSSAFTEEAPAANDFLGKTCYDWEAEAHKAAPELRTTLLRFGIVLGRESGAYPQFVKPLQMSIAPILGSGKQIISWIHIDDLCGMILHSLEHRLEGVYNAVAPQPVSNRQLMQTLRKVHGGYSIAFPVPAFVLRIVLGEMSVEVLKSCNVSAEKIIKAGYTFEYNAIEQAIIQLCK
jgi:uncharacterized protein (TIGR01777 family)